MPDLAGRAAADGVSNMRLLRMPAGRDDAWGQEVQAVVDGWRAVLGPDFPSDGLFDLRGIDIRLAEMAAPAASPKSQYGELAAPQALSLQPGPATNQSSEPAISPLQGPWPRSTISTILADGHLEMSVTSWATIVRS